MINVSELKGVGPKTSAAFKKLGIETTTDLLTYYPKRYEQYLYPVLPENAKPGERAAVIGQFNNSFYSGKNGSLSLPITSANGRIVAKWFHNPYVPHLLRAGKWYVFCGTVSEFNGKLYLLQPTFYEKEEYDQIAGAIMPVYPLRKGLTNKLFFNCVLKAIEEEGELLDRLPEETRTKYDLISYSDAIRCIHYPANFQVLEMARRRLVFDEFFHLFYMVRYRGFARGENTFRFSKKDYYQKAIESLPYTLTASQTKALADIGQDLSSFRVSNRLIQGDVGCGKTVVALLMMILAAENGYQAALMAPTEVLATQHYQEAVKLLSAIGAIDLFKPILLTGSLKEKAKKQIREEIESSKACIIIGTHALIQEKTRFANLALAVIDEQHRFGVEQRKAIADSCENPVHTVIMTATPIPRTTGNIIFGGMDMTIMRDKPSNRLPIKSCTVHEEYRNNVYSLIVNEVRKGHQAYLICPMVDGNEDDDRKNVETYSRNLEKVLPGMRIGSLHGKMEPSEKQEKMEAFERGEYDILVSTTVVEVGVNVPNATVIVIENADAFGMLQLHQLRGRVGRGKDQSYCVFMNSKEEDLEKLNVLSSTNDGFVIAEADYRIRKAGELLGVKQSGDMGFKLADMVKDENIMIQAKEAVDMYFPPNPF